MRSHNRQELSCSDGGKVIKEMFSLIEFVDDFIRVSSLPSSPFTLYPSLCSALEWTFGLPYSS